MKNPENHQVNITFRTAVQTERDTYEFLKSVPKEKGMTIKEYICLLVKKETNGPSVSLTARDIEDIIRNTVDAMKEEDGDIFK